MITSAIMRVLLGFMTFVLGLLPSFTPPAWMADLAGYVSSGLGAFSSLSYWIPVGAVGTVVALVVVVQGIALALKLARMVLSVVTGGGGSAA